MTTDEITQAAKQLIAIPSTADNPHALQAAVSYIAALLAEVPDVTVERLESGGKPSLLAYVGSERPSKFAVTLHGHVDVVPGRPEQFTARVKDGRLYGRGAHDMKVAALALADTFRRAAPQSPYPLGLMIVADEEIGGTNGVQHLVRQGFRTDFAITGEHNFRNNVIYTASRGICWVEVVFRGQTAHGAYVWQGDNALDKATRFAQRILEHFPKPDQERWCTTANIASIYTPNTTYNRIPDQASLRIDFRFTDNDPVFASKQSVESFIHSIDPDAAVVVFPNMEPAVHVPADNPYLRILTAEVEKAAGKPVELESRPAASDARHLAPIGAEVVEYGLTGSGPHGDDEYVELNSIPLYMNAVEQFLTSPALLKLTGRQAFGFANTSHTVHVRPVKNKQTALARLTAGVAIIP